MGNPDPVVAQGGQAGERSAQGNCPGNPGIGPRHRVPARPEAPQPSRADQAIELRPRDSPSEQLSPSDHTVLVEKISCLD